MNAKSAVRSLALLLAWLPLATACAGDCTPQVRDGWVRMLPGGMPMMAGFGRIENRCPTPAAIVSASSPAFAQATLHQTATVDGITRMRAVPELRIAPGGVAELVPGGLHLMLMQPTPGLQPGQTVAIRFTLRDGRAITGDFELRAPVAD